MLKQIEVEITGTKPVIMNRFPLEAGADMSGSTVTAMKKDYGTPREQAELTAYKTDEGDLFIPADNLYAAVIEAGKYHKIKTSKLTTAKSSLVPAFLDLSGVEHPVVLPIKDKQGDQVTQFEVDSRRVVIPATGGSVIRHRARVDEWSVRFVLEVDLSMATTDMARTLVDDAGSKIGIGDFRPSRKGRYGKFKVTSWRELNAA